MEPIIMIEETDRNGDATRVIIRSTDIGYQVDVLAAGNQTGQEYTRQELRMIRALLTIIDLNEIEEELDV